MDLILGYSKINLIFYIQIVMDNKKLNNLYLIFAWFLQVFQQMTRAIKGEKRTVNLLHWATCKIYFPSTVYMGYENNFTLPLPRWTWIYPFENSIYPDQLQKPAAQDSHLSIQPLFKKWTSHLNLFSNLMVLNPIWNSFTKKLCFNWGSDSKDAGQPWHFVWPDLGPKCLH